MALIALFSTNDVFVNMKCFNKLHFSPLESEYQETFSEIEEKHFFSFLWSFYSSHDFHRWRRQTRIKLKYVRQFFFDARQLSISPNFFRRCVHSVKRYRIQIQLLQQRITNSVVNKHSVIRNKILSQIGYISTQIKPVITNKYRRSQSVRYNRVWL
jgi:hypothetical protein